MEETTVILPTFNRSGMLVEALESVLRQTLPPAEIIVADDGSSDDTAARMAPYGGRIRYVRKENSGKAATLNAVLPLASHPLIWIMDDDDIALPIALETMTRLLGEDPDAGLAYGRYRRFRDENGRRHLFDSGHWSRCTPETFLQATLADLFVHHPGMLVRKSAYEAAGPFSLAYPRMEDYEMLVRLARTVRCVGTDEPLFLQRQHDGDRVGGLPAAQRQQRWIDEEKQLFVELHRALALAEYLSPVPRDRPLSPAETREALIRRGAVMGRKKLWDLAIDDFESACSTGASPPLSAGEQAALRYTFFSKYGCHEVFKDRATTSRMRTLAGLGETGRAISREFARAQVYFIRTSAQTGAFVRAMEHAALAIRLATAGLSR